MRLTHNDIEYTFEVDRMTTAEARFIKKQAGGMTVGEFGAGLLRGDPDAITAALYFAKVWAGEAVRWQDLDDVKIFEVIGSIKWSDDDEDDVDGDPEQAEADDPKAAPAAEEPSANEKPPSDDGTTPKSASSGTKPRSRTSSASTPGTSTG